MSRDIGRRTAMGSLAAIAASACTPRPSGRLEGSDPVSRQSATRQPTVYLPHGGGPCFYMDWTMGPPDTWDPLAGWLRGLNEALPATPSALLVVSAHWEEDDVTLTGAPRPELYFDYSGFPPHTYELEWPVPGSPELVARTRRALSDAGLTSRVDEARGLDHGVFVPLKLSYPDAAVPTVQLSLLRGLDPERHLALGRALAPLRDEGVLIVGSGMSYHNMGGLMRGSGLEDSRRFDAWLTEATTADAATRDARLSAWVEAPAARACHPREEHLIPLMVCAGAAGDDLGRKSFSGEAMNAQLSAYVFG